MLEGKRLAQFELIEKLLDFPSRRESRLTVHAATGNSISTNSPGLAFRACSLPLCSSTARRAMASPRRVPPLARSRWPTEAPTTSRCCWATGMEAPKAARSFGASFNSFSMAVGDFNDRRPDLAVANLGSNNVSVLTNNTPRK
jgi:hypothetical protein